MEILIKRRKLTECAELLNKHIFDTQIMFCSYAVSKFVHADENNIAIDCLSSKVKGHIETNKYNEEFALKFSSSYEQFIVALYDVLFDINDGDEQNGVFNFVIKSLPMATWARTWIEYNNETLNNISDKKMSIDYMNLYAIILNSGRWFSDDTYKLKDFCNSYKEKVKIWRASNEETEDLSTSTPKLPKELDTPRARQLLDIAVNANYLNTDYSRNVQAITVAQTALLAEIVSEKLNLDNKWKPFEQLWRMKNFAQTRNNSKEKVGKVRGGEDIERLYK